MKILFLFTTIIFTISSGCRHAQHPQPPANKYAPDVAIEWMNLHMRLTRTTPGFNSVVAGRSFSYAGLTLYASIAPGIHNGHSIFTHLNGDLRIPVTTKSIYFWPASANAAMASITKKLFGNASAENIATIDSLELAFKNEFQSHNSSRDLIPAEDFGRKVAEIIFDWSKTDGGHEAYAKVTSPDYIPPAGPGRWIPTPPAFSAPIHPYWGKNRTFIPNSAHLSQPVPPVPYSEQPGSPFYEMVKELYTISLSLSSDDTTITRFWGDLPANYNVPAHATNIVSQLIRLNDLTLEDAAIAYAKHGMAMSDALVSVLKTKYDHSLIRPISFIRNVMGHAQWNSVIPTPPHPEYTAAHAVVSAASAVVLEGLFGKNYAFTDHTYDALYGTRSFNSFEDYAAEAAYSRVLAGIHYKSSVVAGLEQGKKIGEMINKLPFKKIKAGKL